MSFVIDEDAVRRIVEQQRANDYVVTASNLPTVLPAPSSDPLFGTTQVSGTTISTAPQMSPDTIGRLRDLRSRIVESGTRLLTTEELDNEIAERKGWLAGD